MIDLNNTKEEKKPKMRSELTKKILISLAYALIILLFFIYLGTQYERLEMVTLIKYINSSSILFLLMSIVMMEISYRKSDGSYFFNGIEFLALATFTLLIQHMPKILGCSMQIYTQIGSNLFVVYYILKSAIIYTKGKKEELDSFSDIKEIVKDEPIKKATKRKNKKVEEGK